MARECFDPGDLTVKVRRPMGGPRVDVYAPVERPLTRGSKRALREAILKLKSIDRRFDPSKGPYLKVKRADIVHELERQAAWKKRQAAWEQRKLKWEMSSSVTDKKPKSAYEDVEPRPIQRVRVLKILLWGSEAENIPLALRKIEGELEVILPALSWATGNGGNAGRYGSFRHMPPTYEPVYATATRLSTGR